MDKITVINIFTVLLLAGFFPICAITYYRYRLRQHKVEIERILSILGITSKYREIYNSDTDPLHFAWSVLFTVCISLFGLSILFFGSKLPLNNIPNLLLSGININDSSTINNYQQGALLVYGVSFIGAYLWGIKNIFRRYLVNDLLPATFYRIGIRMIFSSVIALLIYHAIGGFEDSLKTSDGFTPTDNGLLLLLVFLIGMFPQHAINWMTTRLHMLTTDQHPSVRQLPLEMIEGMTVFDKERLEEQSIDSCYDLATADFIPLFVKTPYCSRELIDWILQAKLCVKFGDAVGDLRQQGFRRITDLEDLSDEYLEQLAQDTSLTLSSLQQAVKDNKSDHNIERLNRAAELLGKYWEGDNVV